MSLSLRGCRRRLAASRLKIINAKQVKLIGNYATQPSSRKKGLANSNAPLNSRGIGSVN